MSDQYSMTLGSPTGEGFHAMVRAPRRSTPLISVKYDAPVAMVALDFAVGEPGQERKVLEANRLGEFRFPEIVPAGVLLSLRARAIPQGGEVKIVVAWHEPK